jgi:hypothetical protein
LPIALHPGIGIALRRFGMTETDVARAIAAGELASPVRFGNSVYFALRITGTGTAYRSALGEYVYRKPEHYLNSEFLARCQGLPTILQHPPTDALNSHEFAKRVVGMIVLPYIGTGDGEDPASDEVWGVARILDMPAAEFMETHQLDTSPAVVFLGDSGKDNEKVKLSDGKHLLIEGNPALLDHIAICEVGVWSKSGPPVGVEINQPAEARADSGERTMAEENGDKKVEEKEEEAGAAARQDEGEKKLDKILSGLDSIGKRMDAQDARLDAMENGRKDAEVDKEEEERQAAELERLAAEERAEADRVKKDAEAGGEGEPHWACRQDGESVTEHSNRVHAFAARHDSEEFCREDGESRAEHSKRCDSMAKKARKDAEEGETPEQKEAREKAERTKKDAATHRIVADAEKAIGGLKATVDAQAKTIEDLTRKVEDRPDEDYEALADAQARADEAYSALGAKPPRLASGESPLSYRIRAARGLQEHSSIWKDTDLTAISKTDAAAFGRIEGQVYADAIKAADAPNLPLGVMREVRQRRGGIETVEFKGRPMSWMGTFMAPPRLLAQTSDAVKGGRY